VNKILSDLGFRDGVACLAAGSAQGNVTPVFEPVRWPPEAWVPLVAGVFWNAVALSAGMPWGVPALIPATFFVASGAGMLLYPGDRRISHFCALGGVLGVLLAVPALLVVGATALLLAAAAAAAFVASGRHALRLDPHPEGVPDPPQTARVAAEIALDEAILATMLLTQLFPSTDDHNRIRREVDEAREQFEEAGWLEKPEHYHSEPPALDDATLATAHSRKTRYEHLRFESGYVPHEGEPGRERWQSYTPNRTAHAWVVRGDPAKPWLLCVHGYRMGIPLIDLGAFDPRVFHEKFGLNLLIPVLPLHGPRKIGRRSGDGFLTGDLLDSIHAEAQAMWDLRRLLGWVRAQSDAPVGVYGLSLGGYTASLLASLDDRLACVIAGIPATDFARTFFRHGGPLQERAVAHVGLSPEQMSEVLRVVSPLALPPRVDFAHRAIFAGIVDRLVPPEHVRDLWRHWEEPRIAWYPGSHLTFGMSRDVKTLIRETLRGAGLVA
jgi:hypothetical protein